MQQSPLTNTVIKHVIQFLWTVDDFISVFLIETFKIKGKIVSLVNISTDNCGFNGKYRVPEFFTAVKNVTGKLIRRSRFLDILGSVEG